MSAARAVSALVLGAVLSFAATDAFAQTAGAPSSPAPSAPPFPLEFLKMMQAVQPNPAAPGAAPGDHEETCNASAIASWMPKGQAIDWNSLTIAKIDPAEVHAVKADLPAATAKLATSGSAPVSLSEAARFTGVAAARLKPARAGLTPYLVRSVFPVPDAEVQVTWYGDYLEVMSVGEGCAPFTNTPVLVFLDRAPKDVFAMVANGHGSGN